MIGFNLRFFLHVFVLNLDFMDLLGDGLRPVPRKQH